MPAIETTTGLFRSRTRLTSRQIRSEPETVPPGESIRRTIATTLSSSRAWRRALTVASAPESTIAPSMSMMTTFGAPTSPATYRSPIRVRSVESPEKSSVSD